MGDLLATARAVDGDPGTSLPPPKRSITLVITGGALLLYLACSFLQHWQMFTSGYDLGIFDQAVRQYARFQLPYVALKGPHFNLLGDHFSPILAALAPLYWVWNNPGMLLLAQAILVAASIPAVHSFTARRIPGHGPDWLTLGYALGWPIQSMIGFDFHEIAFAVPLLTLAVDGLDRRSDGQLVWASVLLLFVREDMGAVIAMLGLVRLGRSPRVPGAVLLTGGSLAFAVITRIVIPHFSATGEYSYWNYDQIGPNAAEAVFTLVRHPLRSAWMFVTPFPKYLTLLLLFTPLLFLPLASPYALIAAPLLAGQMFSSRPHLWIPQYHYAAVVWPVLILAAADGAARLAGRTHGRTLRFLPLATLELAVLGTVVFPGAFRFHEFFTGSEFHLTAHMRDQRAVVAAIPSDTCVEADDRLIGHLTTRTRVSIPGLLPKRPDFVALDLSRDEVSYQQPSPTTVQKKIVLDGYRLVMKRGTILLYQRPGFDGPTSACAP